MIKRVSHNYQLLEVIAPPSKSFAQRVIIGAALCKEETKIRYPGQSEDVVKAIGLAEALGSSCSLVNNILTVKPNLPQRSNVFDCGESGLGTRLVTCLAAVLNNSSTVTGSGTLLNRRMSEFENLLAQIGVECISHGGYIPLNIEGAAHAAEIKLDGSTGSQYLSGLLMALPLLDDNSIIHVDNLKSKPYVDITMETLKAFQIHVRNESYTTFYVEGGQSYRSPGEYDIEADWSGAAFWIVLGALKNGIKIRGLNKKSSQADRAILDALELAGGKYEWEYDKLMIHPQPLMPFQFDANDAPDLFPILVVMAAGCEGTSIIKGVNRLHSKESDRGMALVEEFDKMGLFIEIEDDLMYVNGTGELEGATVTSHHDHRIAMACAIASVLTRTGLLIEDAEAVSKSYPEFWEVIGV